MDSLDSLFPTNGGAAPLSVAVGNVPINDVMASMMALIRRQSAEIAKLREETRAQFSEATSHLERHDADIANLSQDLRFDQRPIGCYGQQPMPSMADCVTNVEYRLTMIENREKRALAANLAIKSSKITLLPFFRDWVLHYRRKRALEQVWKSTRFAVFRKFWDAWQASIALRKAQEVNERRVATLVFLNERRTRQQFYNQWVEAVEDTKQRREARRAAAEECTEVLLKLTSRGLARRYFLKWVQHRQEVRGDQARWDAALLLEQKTARSLAVQYMTKWMEFQKLRNVFYMRDQVISVQATHHYRELAARYMGKWQEYTTAQQRWRRLQLTARQYHHMHLAALGRRYFSKFLHYRALRSHERNNGTSYETMDTLNERCDTLGMQLGLGLKTLAHTNSVLARVVDAVMSTGDSFGGENVTGFQSEQQYSTYHESEVQRKVHSILVEDAAWARQAALDTAGEDYTADVDNVHEVGVGRFSPQSRARESKPSVARSESRPLHPSPGVSTVRERIAVANEKLINSANQHGSVGRWGSTAERGSTTSNAGHPTRHTAEDVLIGLRAKLNRPYSPN